MAGTSGSTNQVWGLPEQDSIYGRLRRLSFPAVISTIKFLGSTQQGHHLACTNMPLLIILVITRILSHGQSLVTGSFLPLVQINMAYVT